MGLLILAAVILLLGPTALVQALTGNTVTVQVIIGLAVVVALLAFLPRVVDVESFHMGKAGVTLEMVRKAEAKADEASSRAERALRHKRARPQKKRSKHGQN